MSEPREGALPPELYSILIMATGSIDLASRALAGTKDAYFGIPAYQRPQTLQVLRDPVRSIVENRSIVDTQFKSRFGKRFFRATTDDGRAVVDISSPCENERDFLYKVQALSGLITRARVDAKELIRDPDIRETIQGSINILETILKERFGDFDPEIISGLRKINRLRSRNYPTHTLEPEAIQILEEIGFGYPPSDWNKAWRAVLEIASRSFEKLRDLFSLGHGQGS